MEQNLVSPSMALLLNAKEQCEKETMGDSRMQAGADYDEDDDDLVFYKEQQVFPNHFSLSQTSKTESQDTFYHDPSPMLVRNQCTISRRERRKRRDEWRERQLVEQDEEVADTPPEEQTESAEDTFASLQSLLGPSQGSSASQQTIGKENEYDKTTQNHCSESNAIEKRQLQAKTTRGEQQALEGSCFEQGHSKQTMQAEEAYHSDSTDFDNFQDDFGEDDDEDMKQNPRNSDESTSNKRFRGDEYPRRENKQSKRIQNMRKIRKRASSLSQSGRPQIDFLSASIPTANNARSSSKLSHSYTQTQSATEIQNVKSLVGSRPMHWNREKTRLSPFINSERRERFSKSRFLGSRQTVQSRKYLPNRLKATTRSTTTRTPEDSTGSIATLTFAPSFMPSKRPQTKGDQLVEEGSQDNDRFVTPSSNFSSSPPKVRRRSSRSKTLGVWGRKLGTVQGSRSNDALRIQNQAFCRQTTFDVNGPRKRAKSHTDITILGNCSRPWINGAEDSQFSVLAYVHCHTLRKEPTYNQDDNMLAWVTFTIASARSINLQKGKQIRLYNAVMLPSRVSTTVDGLAIASLKSNTCQRILISTWLCETHPGGLPDITIPPIVA